MILRKPFQLLLVGLAATTLHADFTYEETTRITGGALVGMMKFAGAFSKDARKVMDPIQSTISIKGNRMVHKTADSTSITDLDKETITNVNYANKTYSVMTFAQMKQAMEDMAKKMQRGGKDGQPPPDMNFDVKLNDTGKTKSIAGNQAHEMIMTMTMQGTDAKSGAKGGIDMTNDMWIAPKVAGYQEVRDYYRRMSEKLAWMPGTNPMMSRPDVARAMGEFYKEGSKLDGMPVFSIIRMGGSMEGMPTESAQSTQSARNQSDSQRNSPPPTSVSGALGAALGGRFGMGGLGRKKKDDSNSSSSSSSSNSSSGESGSNAAAGSLMEMTMEVSSYSSAPADPALFEVPAGFSQVQEDPMHPNRRQK